MTIHPDQLPNANTYCCYTINNLNQVVSKMGFQNTKLPYRMIDLLRIIRKQKKNSNA